jgi:ParB family chromosome partitioning protein
VNAVQAKGDHAASSRLVNAQQLADALALDMRSRFVPGAENYFGRINRSGILAAIDEAKGSHAPALDKLKKAELAIRAQDLVANTNWLPEPMRATTVAA